MNQTLSTFLKIAVTVVSISAFLFFIGYNMVGGEVTTYETKIDTTEANLPSGTGLYGN